MRAKRGTGFWRGGAAGGWGGPKPLETDVCPFANLPEEKRTPWALTKNEMKKCIWLRPELVAQIEFTSWTLDGHLRLAAFAGLRDDKKATEVVRESESEN